MRSCEIAGGHSRAGAPGDGMVLELDGVGLGWDGVGRAGVGTAHEKGVGMTGDMVGMCVW